jgi:hypothetical protein
MKKFISGVVVGALLMVSTQAFGANINFIGKKVANETVVKVNGEEAGKAIIVENKSFIPVRDISEKIGAEIAFEKGGVIALTTEQVPTTPTTPDTPTTPSVEVTNLEKAIKKKNEEIADTKYKITATSEKVEQFSDLTSSAINAADRQRYQLNHDAFKKSLDQLEVTLTDQETELADLEAQLAELQK